MGHLCFEILKDNKLIGQAKVNNIHMISINNNIKG